jgi:hypothetical protein
MLVETRTVYCNSDTDTESDRERERERERERQRYRKRLGRVARLALTDALTEASWGRKVGIL